MSSPRYKRRITLIQPGLQLRLVGAFAALSAMALLAQVALLGLLLAELAQELPSGGAYVSEALPGLLVRSLVFSALLLLPALLLIGVRITFRIAGPLHRFELHLRSVVNGERPGDCRIRQEDELQEFCGLLNDALDTARAEGRSPADTIVDEPATAARESAA